MQHSYMLTTIQSLPKTPFTHGAIGKVSRGKEKLCMYNSLWSGNQVNAKMFNYKYPMEHTFIRQQINLFTLRKNPIPKEGVECKDYMRVSPTSSLFTIVSKVVPICISEVLHQVISVNRGH
ncbi:hypothetical protein NE237_021539 [Protea cynaroides]|uniref:Uncharacterized protein n=1 Tax=Protea cynaroides TaxID=273540 RepID=A0A9Q0HDH1_9MAGN|nr:hypothetical protein NE237_021539 [Protea cynaroides]